MGKFSGFGRLSYMVAVALLVACSTSRDSGVSRAPASTYSSVTCAEWLRVTVSKESWVSSLREANIAGQAPIKAAFVSRFASAQDMVESLIIRPFPYTKRYAPSRERIKSLFDFLGVAYTDKDLAPLDSGIFSSVRLEDVKGSSDAVDLRHLIAERSHTPQRRQALGQLYDVYINGNDHFFRISSDPDLQNRVAQQALVDRIYSLAGSRVDAQAFATEMEALLVSLNRDYLKVYQAIVAAKRDDAATLKVKSLYIGYLLTRLVQNAETSADDEAILAFLRGYEEIRALFWQEVDPTALERASLPKLETLLRSMAGNPDEGSFAAMLASARRYFDDSTNVPSPRRMAVLKILARRVSEAPATSVHDDTLIAELERFAKGKPDIFIRYLRTVTSGRDMSAFFDRIVQKRFAKELGDPAAVERILGVLQNSERDRFIERALAKAIEDGQSLESVSHFKKYVPNLDRRFAAATLDKDPRRLTPEILLRQQSVAEEKLRAELRNVIQANAPPADFPSWGAYAGQLPENMREGFVRSLLERDATPARIADIVATLNPDPQTVRAVQTYFRRNPGPTRIDQYSQPELVKMFGNGRFRRFFPHSYADMDPSNNVGRQVKIALYTAPVSDGPATDMPWLVARMNDGSAISRVLGYRPAGSIGHINEMLPALEASGVEASTVTGQIRGYIVQGAYDNNGHTFFSRQLQRGQGQVEDDLPRLLRRVERSLAGGALQKVSPLERKLFVQNWGGFSGNGDLIQRIRLRAIQIADNDNERSAFWNLRVEIHNFPSRDVLNRTKAYADRHGYTDNLTKIIAEMEELLGVGQAGSGNSLAKLVESLPLSAESKAGLTRHLESRGSDPESEAKAVLAIRRELEEAFAKGSSHEQKLSQSILWDQRFAQRSMNALADVARDLKAPRNDGELIAMAEKIGLFLDHIEQDGMLSAKQVEVFKQLMSQIFEEKGLELSRRAELLMNLSKNAVDQVYFRLEADFGAVDERLFHVFYEAGKPPPRFIDGTMRSHTVFLLSQLVDNVERSLAKARRIVHHVGSARQDFPVEVFNPGEVVATLRLNKNPMELVQGEIGVFDSVPPETGALSGIITLGVGARLSHLQLLAKSLQIPNAKISPDFLDELRKLDGQLVRYRTTKTGELTITPVKKGARGGAATQAKVEIPVPNHGLRQPISFEEAGRTEHRGFAGPKGVQLSKMRVSPSLGEMTPDGFILPFGFFDRYVDLVGLRPWIELLEKVDHRNALLVSSVAGRIRRTMREQPVPEELLDQVMAALKALEERNPGSSGYFFRSDTNIEDLPNFNGAGLNESVANVGIDREAVANALRRVWASPFKEKSIFWRAMALDLPTVAVAEPSIVVMPTVRAASSGVMISRGGGTWMPGRGFVSANWGIGSVVEAGRPVEEITLETGIPLRFSTTVSDVKPTAVEGGGVKMEPVAPGTVVLSDDQIRELNRLGQEIESVLGEEPHGWDIEWAIDDQGRVRILQARPNM